MAEDAFTPDDLVRIVQAVQGSPQIRHFRLQSGAIDIELRSHGGTAAVPAPVPAPGPAAIAAPQAMPAAAPHAVRAGTVGRFLRAPEGGAAWVEPGDTVAADTQVGAIDVLRRIEPVLAGRAGVVGDILVEHGAAVEYDQVLMTLAG